MAGANNADAAKETKVCSLVAPSSKNTLPNTSDNMNKHNLTPTQPRHEVRLNVRVPLEADLSAAVRLFKE